MFELLEQAKVFLEKERKPDDYNVGINVGESSRQSVWHVHAHLIPCYISTNDPERWIKLFLSIEQKGDQNFVSALRRKITR